eukprot:Pgem_evm1s8580
MIRAILFNSRPNRTELPVGALGFGFCQVITIVINRTIFLDSRTRGTIIAWGTRVWGSRTRRTVIAFWTRCVTAYPTTTIISFWT